MSASHAQQLSETRQRILHLLLSEHDLVDVLLDKSVDLNAAELRKITGWRQQLEHDLPQLHAADLADILEALPEEERSALGRLGPYEQRGRLRNRVGQPDGRDDRPRNPARHRAAGY